MSKPRINEIESKEYPYGRIDKVKIETKMLLINSMMALFKELKFSKETILDLDTNYKEIDYLFFYTRNIKAHLFGGEEIITLILDSNINKKKLFNIIEKYFQIF